MGYWPRIPQPQLDPPEPKAVGTCKHCNEEICVGDEIAEISGDYYHLGCFTDNAAGILIREFGAQKLVAEDGGCYG